jgi:rsbT co-antagonist protein RsbR
MAANEKTTLAKLVSDNESAILPEWLGLQKKSGALQTGRVTEAELNAQSREFLHRLSDGLSRGGTDISHSSLKPALEFLGEISRSRALQGFLLRRPRPLYSR